MAKIAKPRNVFNLVEDMFVKKIPWNKLPESDRKLYSPYIINMAISQKIHLIDLVNYLQRFNLTLDHKLAYTVYIELLPNGKQPWSKFIKAAEDSTTKQFSDELVEFIAKRENISTKECLANLKLLKISNDYDKVLYEYMSKFGFDDKELSKKYKIKKVL